MTPDDLPRLLRDIAEETLFELANTTPHRPWRGDDHGKGRQKTLFSGLDCLPGQRDLFPTDGEATDDD